MSGLFKKLPSGQKRTIRYEILLSQKEADEIRNFALIRNLSVAEYMRRSSLHRRTDIRYETETVLALREVVQSIRQLHAIFIDKEVIPPRRELSLMIEAALAAMLRVSK